MGLSVSSLKSLMLSKINKETNKLSAHAAIASAINEHVLAKAQVKGAYVGVTPSGSPDPNNGSYDWPCIACAVSSAVIAGAASGNQHSSAIKSWGNAIASQLLLTVKFGGAPIAGAVTMTPIPMISIQVIVVMNKESAQSDAMTNVAKAVVNGMKSAAPTPTSVGVSPAGTGTVTLGAIS